MSCNIRTRICFFLVIEADSRQLALVLCSNVHIVCVIWEHGLPCSKETLTLLVQAREESTAYGDRLSTHILGELVASRGARQCKQRVIVEDHCSGSYPNTQDAIDPGMLH